MAIRILVLFRVRTGAARLRRPRAVRAAKSAACHLARGMPLNVQNPVIRETA